MYNWHKLEIELPGIEENKPLEIGVADKKVCILKKGGLLFAFAALCPHAGAPLCEGWVDGLGKLVCPLHKYRFDPQNGRNTSGEGYKLFTYPIEHRDDGIYIGLRNLGV